VRIWGDSAWSHRGPDILAVSNRRGAIAWPYQDAHTICTMRILRATDAVGTNPADAPRVSESMRAAAARQNDHLPSGVYLFSHAVLVRHGAAVLSPLFVRRIEAECLKHGVLDRS
jgi:hypothetical protein